MDGRQCFVTEGPAEGQVEKPNVLLASGDRIAVDAEAIKILRSYKAKNKLEFEDPFQYPQLQRAAQLRLGVKSVQEIKVVKT